MNFIYLDESGNLGFSEKSTQYFVVAALCCNEMKTVDMCIKRVRNGLTKKYKKNEMKFSNSSDTTRRRVLKCIARRDVSIAYLSLDKNWVDDHLRDKPQVIHKYMFGQLLTNILHETSISRTKIIVDKFLDYKRIEEFDSYINKKISVRGDIEHVSSQSNNGIQAVDFVVGAVHRKYRNNDDIFHNIILDKIDLTLDSKEIIFTRK
ncbi:MAG: DUF3800 domain-containing protein [Methanobacterium sp.]|nr:DUF3800 domain-containing protein [Methanobacterium sp.]